MVGFELNMWNSGEDGVDFKVTEGANSCLDVNPLPAGAEVLRERSIR